MVCLPWLKKGVVIALGRVSIGRGRLESPPTPPGKEESPVTFTTAAFRPAKAARDVSSSDGINGFYAGVIVDPFVVIAKTDGIHESLSKTGGFPRQPAIASRKEY